MPFPQSGKALSAAKEAVEKSNDEQVSEWLAADLFGGGFWENQTEIDSDSPLQ